MNTSRSAPPAILRHPLALGAAGSVLALSCALHTSGTGESPGTSSTSASAGSGGAATTSSMSTSSTGGKGGAGGTGGMPAVCGDGKVEGQEACDDGNDADDDGCASCAVAPGYTCSSEPSACVPIPPQTVTVGSPNRLEMSITDQANHYDGTIPSMDCATITLADQGFPVIHRVILVVGIDHPYVGDLVLELVSPKGTVSTIFSRPGLDEPADTYDESNGDGSDVSADHPLTFRDDETDDAEQMGDSIDGNHTVCKDDARCSYHPNPGKGPGTSLADFNGEPPAGDWRVCLADGDNNDAGKLQTATLTVLAWQQ